MGAGNVWVKIRCSLAKTVPLTENSSANDEHADAVGIILTVAVKTFVVEKQLDTPMVIETGWPSSALVGVTASDVQNP